MPTTIPEIISTKIPKIVITTVPTTIQTTIITTTSITKIPTTIVQDQCKYGILINYTSSFSNLTNEVIYNNEIQSIISSYCLNGSSVTVKGQDSYFQITTTKHELERNNRFSNLDLTQCENILKEKYDIDRNASLIILKFLTDDGQNIQYELYNPFTHEKLNLSYCQNTTVEVYVSVELDEKIEEILNNAKDQGYDPLDLNDKFYREICTPYTSENGTDVLLDDREEFVYSSLVNTSVCPIGCNYSELVVDKKYIKCDCDMNTVGIETLDLENLSGENIGNSFLTTLQSTNWKVMRCYNLVFNFKIFCHNYGSILVLILFFIYVIFMIYYFFKGVTPLKVEISKILFEDIKEEKEIETKLINYYDKLKIKQTQSEKIKGNYPPKKGKVKVQRNKKVVTFENNLSVFESKEHKKKVKYDNKSLKTEHNVLISQKRKTQNMSTKDCRSTKPAISTKYLMEKDKMDKKLESETKIEDKNKEGKNLDDFELNNLGFNDACKLDKRSCLRTYWSVLKREHTVLVTFIARNDYNLFYVKIERFFILFCIQMTMNGLFFVHESMHRKYTENQDLTFAQKLPQYIFTLIVSHVLEVIICFLGMTDTDIYEIKALPSRDKKNSEKIVDILSKIKKKLASFFCFTFILFLFFWYFISAFCAVYQNTQTIFLRDSMISFAVSLIDPFLIYGFTSLLRFISLTKVCKKKCCGGCLYKTSDLIPIF